MLHLIMAKTVNIYIVYEISKHFNISSYPTFENCLFGAVKFTTNVDIDQYKYSGYCIGFDNKGKCSFGVDMTPFVHVQNKVNDILILGEGSIQGFDGTTLTAEKNNQLFLLKITKFLFELAL